MEKLQELLKGLSDADEYQIDNLYECLINENVHYIEDCFKDKNIYKEFKEEIENDAIKYYKEHNND